MKGFKLWLSLFLMIFFTHLNQLEGQVIYNAYAGVTNITSGTLLAVSNVTQTYHSFTVGENVIIMQMQDNVIGTNTTNATTFGNLGGIASAGLYEVATIASVNLSAGTPTSIGLTSALINSYNTGANSAVQIISFRKLSAAAFTTTNNITGLAWTGTVGGVIALEIGTTLTLNHNISADGIGFRGGSKNTPNGYSTCDQTTYQTAIATRYAGKGEGIYKNTNAAFTGARGKILTGGGGGNDVNAGGGGGGNYTGGGTGGSGWVPAGTGCNPIAGGLGAISLSTSINASRIFMGGGGGGGHENDGVGTAGGAGGGIILLKTGTLITTGTCGGRTISANGAAAGNASNDGSGGGGAAGSVVMQVNNYSIVSTCSLAFTSSGGNGGSSVTSGAHGGGGGGGQGVIIFSTPQPTVNTSVNTIPGNGGTSCSGCTGTINPTAGIGPNNAGIIINSSGPLPIELIYFRANNMSEKVNLSWATATEKNTDYFIVERSKDALSWENIGKVKAAENSNLTLYYEFDDEAPLEGISYYRLKIVDLDFTEDFSNTQAIDRGNKEPYIIYYPNPTSGVFNIVWSGKSQQIDYQLIDISGKIVQVIPTSTIENKVTLDISALAKGVYFLNIALPGVYKSSNKIILK